MKFKVIALNLESSLQYPGHLQNFSAVLVKVDDNDYLETSLTLTIDDTGVSELDWTAKLELGQIVELDL